MMRLAKWLMLLGAIAFGWNAWRDHARETELAALTSPTGFVPVIMPDGATANTVIVFAPQNCPKESAQRAEDLAQRLVREGIPTQRSSSYSVQIADVTAEQRVAMQRTDTVMRGEIPAVLVNGMGKANPSAEDVIAEYRRTRQARK